MAPLAFQREPVMRGRGERVLVFQDRQPLSFAQALDGLADSAAFRNALSQAITDRPAIALRWETPPITSATVTRPFEFVLVDDPLLHGPPEPDVFGPHFDGAPAGETVRAVPNLGRTADLVVPRQLTDPHAYVHLKVFLQRAPAAQLHALWHCVAVTARQRLSDRPLWISTAGGGVSWLHVRLERVPKYYAYRPYTVRP